MQRSGSELDLPGFRFHPTEEELLDFYLRRMVHSKKVDFDIIGTLDIYRHEPWDLPKLAKIGEREWYFFVPRDRKLAHGGRPNRTTEGGFWKATGSDRSIRSAADPKRLMGLKKTLVFYTGRAPRGSKTDWVMNEYRLPDASSSKKDIVLCKIYRKATSLKELEQRAAMEEERRASQTCTTMTETVSNSDLENLQKLTALDDGDVKEMKEEAPKEVEVSSNSFRSVILPELQLPHCSLDWMQDSFQRGTWMEQWSPFANILNF